MATVSVVKVKVRRGSDNDRKQITLDVGEIGYVTDPASRRLFVGDGSTRGGNPAGIKFYTGNLADPIALMTTQVGDIIYNTVDNKLYALTGVNVNNFPHYDNPSAYQFIGSRVDNSSIEYNVNGQLKIKQNGVLGSMINSAVVDTTQGLERSPGGTISVKYDNTTIKVNGSGELYTDPSGLPIGGLQSLNQTIDATSLSLSNLPASDPGIPGRLYRNGGDLRISI